MQCIECGMKYNIDEIIYECRNCHDLLTIEFSQEYLKESVDLQKFSSRPLSVWRYRELLPIKGETVPVSLMEGGTRLFECSKLAKEIGVKKLFVKYEGENPTGSFKDRGMTVGVTKALELGAKMVICASTGNTSSSLAAYSAKAGLKCIVVIPSGKIALGKLAQSMIYGAKVIAIRGNFDQALSLVLNIGIKHATYILNSINPFRLEGQKTGAFEIFEQLGKIPDRIVIPVGNAGNVSAYFKGFQEFHQLDIVERIPMMTGIQAKGAAPIADAIKKGKRQIVPIISPETVATAIRIGKPVSWKKAIKAILDSKGTAETVTDREILNAQKSLASKEGIFVEPASASTIAGLKKLVESGTIKHDEEIVCITTGHGLKDPNIVIKSSKKEIIEIEPTEENITKVL